MLIRAGGGTGGLKEYLEHGQKAGRDFHRNELDQRVPLLGDLAVFEMATNIYQGDGKKYDHFTLGFSENNVSDEMLLRAVDEFMDHAFSAYSKEERHRIPLYAEAHRPRILSYTDKETSKDVERLIHIHIGIGKHDLVDGSFLEPMGFLGERSDNRKYIDAFQESFNSRHGFKSPKDSPNITQKNAIDVLAGFGTKPDELGNQNEKKAALEVTLQKEIISQNVTTWADFEKLLSKHGQVSKINEGKLNETYRVKLPSAEKAIRLKGVFFQRQFIERPTSEKVDIIQAKAKAVYLEQMQPRKEPEYVNGILSEWHQIRAKELRYLNTGSKLYKEKYLPADAQTRLQIINDIERKDHGITSPATAKNRAITPARNRVPSMPIRDMDGIQSRTEMLLRSDAGMDVRADAGREQMGAGLRQADGRGGVEAGEESQRRRAHLVQPSSVAARFQSEMLDRYDQAADKDRYSEIRQHLDCTQLLASLSHTHGLNPNLYQVVAAKDGTPRILCGTRALTPADFLTKELGLPWMEAAPILRLSYENQLGKRVATGRVKPVVSPLWREFKASQLAEKPALEQQRRMFDVTTKRHRADLFSRLKSEQQQALAGLTGSGMKAAQSLAKLNAATAKAEFNDERRAMRKALKPAQAQAWRSFLQARAQIGNEEALATLRKLDATARAAPAQGITGTIYLGDDEDEKKRRRRAKESAASILKALVYQVEANGDVTYSQHGQAVLRDEGQHIAVLDQNSDEAIAAALLLAREKFGQNLTLTGSPEFQRRVVAVAVAQGIPIKFVDPKLEAMRLQLTDQKHQAARTPTPIQPIREAVPPVVPSAEHQHPEPETEHPVLLDEEVQKPGARAEELPPVDYLDDIHQQIASAKAAADPRSMLAQSTTEEGDHDAPASGTIIAANEEFVAVHERNAVKTYLLAELARSVTYDGTSNDTDRFSLGNDIERKNGRDGMRTLVTENRDHMQTEAKRERGLDTGHGL